MFGLFVIFCLLLYLPGVGINENMTKVYIKDKNYNIYTDMVTDRLAYSKDPKMVVPVYIRDFLGDYTDVSTHGMRKVYESFTQKYCDKSTKKLAKDANCNINLFDAISIEMVVSEVDFMKTTDELLTEINFEAAMKMLPTNRIIKLYVTALDEAADVEYKTNGVRVRVDTDTNFTGMVHSIIDQMHPDTQKLKLMALLIRGGLGALACDEHIPTLDFVDDTSDDSVDSDA
jgi:hypothetical protein